MNEDDFDNYNDALLETVLQFNELFSQYVKEMDPELWKKAREYAKDFSKTKGIQLEDLDKKTPENILSDLTRQTLFIKVTAASIQATAEEYAKFVHKNRKLSVQDIQKKWLKENNEYGCTKEDPFGTQGDINLFVECDHRFNFDQFDTSDWTDYIYVLINCTNNPEFVHNFAEIFDKYHQDDQSEVYQYYTSCMETFKQAMNIIKETDDEEDEN